MNLFRCPLIKLCCRIQTYVIFSLELTNRCARTNLLSSRAVQTIVESAHVRIWQVWWLRWKITLPKRCFYSEFAFVQCWNWVRYFLQLFSASVFNMSCLSVYLCLCLSARLFCNYRQRSRRVANRWIKKYICYFSLHFHHWVIVGTKINRILQVTQSFARVVIGGRLKTVEDSFPASFRLDFFFEWWLPPSVGKPTAWDVVLDERLRTISYFLLLVYIDFICFVLYFCN